MDVRRLEVLRDLQLRGSVTAVARATFRSPSAVSQQLKQLEREVGMPLTERAGRGIVLTHAGEALAAGAADIAVAIERATALWNAYVRSPAGGVRLATFPTAGRMFLPGLLAGLVATPGLDLEATDVDPPDGDFAALANDYDLLLAYAVGPDERWQRHDLTVVPLLDEPLDVALAADHPLARRATLRARDLAAEPWIGVRSATQFERILHEIERSIGAPLDVRQRFTDTRITESLVAAGAGIALLPRFTSGRPDSGVVLRPLVDIAPTRRIAALHLAEAAERPSVRAVLDALHGIARDLEGAV